MKEHIIKLILLFIGAAALMVACRPKPAAVIEPLKTTVQHAEWTRNMVLYEINTRQFSEEGT
ncbi:MAG: alpha-amylase, partial [Bacteroidales bacterium]|nr:alpha-amylase [Bacteroidales bacterium]